MECRACVCMSVCALVMEERENRENAPSRVAQQQQQQQQPNGTGSVRGLIAGEWPFNCPLNGSRPLRPDGISSVLVSRARVCGCVCMSHRARDNGDGVEKVDNP
jgi:hypothetical protein